MPEKPAVKVENPTAFKHWIDVALLRRMATALSSAHRGFEARSFLELADHLEPLELKQRVCLVREGLRARLPIEFPSAVAILLGSLKHKNLTGFDLWPYTEFVQTYGLEHFDESMNALRELTKLFTAEFAVRPFLRLYPERTLLRLSEWANDKDIHVRRLVSEGTRPRLPWGERLGHFIKNPALTLVLLEQLKHDPELYVRKSVANHLNDIAKDHPELVVKTLKRWLARSTDADQLKRIQWIRGRSLRTLIKQGHPGALGLMGFRTDAKIRLKGLTLNKKKYRIRETLEFQFELVSRSRKEQKLVVDYVIHHVRGNKGRTPKVFKLKNVTLMPGESLRITKKHSLKPITTRRYYSGKHLLEIQVNGKILSGSEWHLAA